MALLALAACSSQSETRPLVRVQLDDGGQVSSFFATVVWEDGQVDELSCPVGDSAAPETLRCVSGGFEIVGAGRPTELTLRARGHAFERVTLAEGEDDTTVSLTPLADAENAPEYATRLDGDACLDALDELALAFRSDSGESRSVKFYIRDLATDPKVYFQNTRKYPLHFEFARNVLGIPGTADQFALDTYTGVDRPAMAGTLISYPSVSGSANGATREVESPWTLNFFPGDSLTTDQVRLAHRLLEERITCLDWTGAARRLVYVPASSAQESAAAADDMGFLRAGIGWMSHAQLASGLSLQALNDGVAFGTLLRMSPEELSGTVVSFRDILLLTRLPNEPPLAGGIISEEFQTPLAHVNIAARSRGTPNLAYPDAFRDPAIAPRIGKLVRFEVTPSGFTLEDATLEQAQAFWDRRVPERFVPTFDATTTGVPKLADVGFADAIRIGSKAANLAELSHALGQNAPRTGLAVPFHYYEEFMSSSRTSIELCDAAESRCLNTGRDALACGHARELCIPDGEPETFSAFIDRLLQDPDFNQDTALRDALLFNLRHGVESTPVSAEFGELLDARVAEVFGQAKVKLRSSTNTEDLPGFSGAGLYESYGARASGGDAASKVIPKVFASVWSFRAFEERSFWNIDHAAVRMGCAVNEAFTDELANGVLITQNIADPTVFGMYVNVQKGEASVTNPQAGELPEVFSILADTGYQVTRTRFSSLSPEAPILSDGEVQELYEAGDRARAHFAKLYGRELILDIEFKLTPDHRIVFKQARPYTP